MGKIKWEFPRDLSTLALHSAIELDNYSLGEESPFAENPTSKLAQTIKRDLSEKFSTITLTNINFLASIDIIGLKGKNELDRYMKLFAYELENIRPEMPRERLKALSQYCLKLSKTASEYETNLSRTWLFEAA